MGQVMDILVKIIVDYDIRLKRLKSNLGVNLRKRYSIVQTIVRSAWNLLRGGHVKVEVTNVEAGTGVVTKTKGKTAAFNFRVNVRSMTCECRSSDAGYCVHHYLYIIIIKRGDMDYYGGTVLSSIDDRAADSESGPGVMPIFEDDDHDDVEDHDDTLLVVAEPETNFSRAQSGSELNDYDTSLMNELRNLVLKMQDLPITRRDKIIQLSLTYLKTAKDVVRKTT